MSKMSKKQEKILIKKVNDLKERVDKIRESKKDKKWYHYPMSILTVVFIVLKLTGNIDWSWFWVCSPMIAPIVLYATFAILAFPVLWIQQDMKRSK